MLHAMAERGIPSISGGQDTSTEERGMDGENKQERRPVMTGVRWTGNLRKNEHGSMLQKPQNLTKA